MKDIHRFPEFTFTNDNITKNCCDYPNLVFIHDDITTEIYCISCYNTYYIKTKSDWINAFLLDSLFGEFIIENYKEDIYNRLPLEIQLMIKLS